MITELLPPETGRAFDAMRELRPRLASREEFVRLVDELQRPSGYRIVAVLTEELGAAAAVAVAGFRVGDNLAWGRHVYVDDLSTMPGERGRGHAGALLGWIHDEAERLGCTQVHLDSGVGGDRATAHRLYLTHGYRIVSHHFSREVGGSRG